MKPKTALEQILFSTVRIEVDKPAGTEAGTSFVFDYEHESAHYLFLVTNKHVVAKSTTGRFFFTLSQDGNPKIGDRFDVEMPNFEEQWTGHPDTSIDVTVMPLIPVLEQIKKLGASIFFMSIPMSLIPSESQLEELDVMEEIVFVGYPSGMFDQKNLMPILRRGITATPPQLDYGGSKVFLVDASVFPGSSGSPVLICNLGSFGTKKGLTIGNRVLLLGVIAQVAYREEEGKFELVTEPSSVKPKVTTREMLDLGIVFKSAAIVEAVEHCLRQRGVFD